MKATNKDWARAIASRIADECDLKTNSQDDAKVFQKVLEELLAKNPWAIEKLVGTFIIEESYFEHQ